MQMQCLFIANADARRTNQMQCTKCSHQQHLPSPEESTKQTSRPDTQKGPVSRAPRKQTTCSRNTHGHGKSEPGSPEPQACRVSKPGLLPLHQHGSQTPQGQVTTQKARIHTVMSYTHHSSSRHLVRTVRTHATLRCLHEFRQSK